MRPTFKHHLKPQPRLKTEVEKKFDKRCGLKFDVDGFSHIECRPISNRPGASPVAIEKSPAYDINIHARDVKGYPRISGIMHASMRDFSLVLTLLITSYCRQQNLDIDSFFAGLKVAVNHANNAVQEC